VYIRYLLNPVLGRDAPFLPAVIAVAAAAWYGGLGPGLLATAVSAISGMALFLEPWGLESNVLAPVSLMRMLVFLLTGAMISMLTGALQQTTHKWRHVEETAEQAREYAVLQERNRLAREIHDTLAQGFTGIVIQLEAAEDSLHDDPQEAQAHIARARTLARESLAEARRSVQALRPHLLEQRDLSFALKYYVEQMTAGTPVLAEVIVEGTPPPTLPTDTERHLLRVGLEALTNTLKHANARHVRVRLAFSSDGVYLSVTDDGNGFDTKAAWIGADSLLRDKDAAEQGFGLAAMRERAERIGGRLRVESTPGKGCTVSLTIPVQPSRSEDGSDRPRAASGKEVSHQ
jgi:signal transduction histidine kinase